ncbi:MAG: apolipoprotein N-acyltransferase [Proteobacteria bacterium]|nr:apolipoprotein N-acyltransferase [Pseudomonadota bacterium]
MSIFRRRALALVSGLALAASFPSLDLWPLAWVAFAPLMLAVRGLRPAAAARLGWLAGLCFFVPALYWLSPTVSNYTRLGQLSGALVVFAMAGGCACFTAAFAAGLEALAGSRALASRALLRPALAAPLWVVLEWSRTFFPAAFPWAVLGYTQQPVLSLVQSADLGGVWLVSGLLVFTASVLAEAMAEGPRRARAWLVAALLLFLVNAGYGAWRLDSLSRLDVKGELDVGLVQGNVAQGHKWDDDWQDRILERYIDLSRRSAGDGARLLAWPESALPFFIRVDSRAAALHELTGSTGTWLLTGAPGYESRDGGPLRAWNRAWMLEPGGGLQGPYDKMQLVPFGEYVPWGLDAVVDKIVQAVGSFGRGDSYVIFEGPPRQLPAGQAGGEEPLAEGSPVRVAALICYEGIFPALVRRFVNDGAELLVNLSNDAWYGRSSAPWQHLRMVALRAVENRVPVVRATNTGVSAAVDISGRIHSPSQLFEQAVVNHRVQLGDYRSPYSRLGDLFVYLCAAWLAALFGYCCLRRSGVEL